MRETLQATQVDTKAMHSIQNFHSDVVKEVKDAVSNNKVVVVGMAQNPVVKKARGILAQAKVDYKYLEYGNYFKAWKPRLAIKLWSGWPTYPQIFINGQLIGGGAELIEWMKSNKFK
jgi:monothiol glutaredoxin